MIDHNEHKRDIIYYTLKDKCNKYALANETVDDFKAAYSNATKYQIDPSSIANFSEPIYSPTYPNMTYAEAYKQDCLLLYTNFDDSTYYAAGLCVYFGVVMLLGTIFNFLTKVGFIQKLNHPIINKIRSYITIPTMFPKGRNAQPMGGLKVFTGLFPDRVDSLICLGFTIVHIVFWAIPNYHGASANIQWKDSDSQVRQLLGNETGILAFAEVTLLVLFAGRNNILTFITGFKYTSFIHFHKLVSRFMILDAIIHSVCFTILDRAYWSAEIAEEWFACGIAATTIAVTLSWLLHFWPCAGIT
ncbi:unnamed protein product [Ambrosiozyma monospora]|uniref:Unnamed protein product n=1 Tax=Ambrosiozyma monospora TaxID=43982 RepID=A0ACB5TR20_AMBMO|nr:unnamed protein product [Ambrosiozyma monospora]